VGRDAAHTPSFLSVLSSILEATTKGGAHYRQEKVHLLMAIALAGQDNKINQCQVLSYPSVSLRAGTGQNDNEFTWLVSPSICRGTFFLTEVLNKFFKK